MHSGQTMSASIPRNQKLASCHWQKGSGTLSLGYIAGILPNVTTDSSELKLFSDVLRIPEVLNVPPNMLLAVLTAAAV